MDIFYALEVWQIADSATDPWKGRRSNFYCLYKGPALRVDAVEKSYPLLHHAPRNDTPAIDDSCSFRWDLVIDNKQELLRIPSTFAIMFGDSTHGTVGLGQCSIAFNKLVRRVDGLDILKIVQEVVNVITKLQRKADKSR